MDERMDNLEERMRALEERNATLENQIDALLERLHQKEQWRLQADADLRTQIDRVRSESVQVGRRW